MATPAGQGHGRMGLQGVKMRIWIRIWQPIRPRSAKENRMTPSTPFDPSSRRSRATALSNSLLRAVRMAQETRELERPVAGAR